MRPREILSTIGESKQDFKLLYYEGANDGRCLNFGNLNSPPEQESRSMASSCRMSAVHAIITVPSPSKKKSFSKMDIPSLRASLFLTDLD